MVFLKATVNKLRVLQLDGDCRYLCYRDLHIFNVVKTRDKSTTNSDCTGNGKGELVISCFSLLFLVPRQKDLPYNLLLYSPIVIYDFSSANPGSRSRGATGEATQPPSLFEGHHSQR